MKIEDFNEVRRLHEQVASLDLSITLVETNGVTIQGRYQDDHILNPVRPVVVAVLKRERAKRHQALRELGVDVPAEPIIVTNDERYEWLKENATQTPDEHGQAEQLYFGTYAAGDLDGAIDDAIRASQEPSPQMPLLPGVES